MTELEKKSHNISGVADDIEFVEMYNLDPAVAYTPEINEVMVNAVKAENLAYYIDQGMVESEAEMIAEVSAAGARKRIAEVIKKRGF